MIWIVVSLVIIIFSTVLACWRYLELSTRLRQLDSPPTIFIIQNHSILTPLLIEQLVSELPKAHTGIAIEILKRGRDTVLLMVVPRWIINHHPEIKILEIEDYLPSLSTQAINIARLQFDDPNLRTINSGFLSQIFEQLELANNEAIFFQIVTRPYTPGSSELDANIRVIISSHDAGRSSQIEQQFFGLLKSNSCLIPSTSHQNSPETMNNYRARSFAKRESLCSPLTSSEFTQFLI